jgi:hypothetical protein
VTPKRYNKIFLKIQSIRGFFGNTKTGFGIFLAHLVCLRSEK